MPTDRMNLKFLNNPSQRLAVGKSLPTKQLEAIVIYGAPEQRVKVVNKILPQAYILAMNNQTHHLLVSIIKACDNSVRAQMLYELRRKIPDMARSKIANTVLLALIENVPAIQKKEIAESFTINVDEEELLDLCRHEAGNLVVQKLLEYPVSADVIIGKLEPHFVTLVNHPCAQHVISKIISSVSEGAAAVSEALFPGGSDDDEVLEIILQTLPESAVVCALVKHECVDDEIKNTIVRHVISKLEELTDISGKYDDDDDDEGPTFGPITAAKTQSKEKEPCGRHNFLISTCLEHCDEDDVAELKKKLLGDEELLIQMCKTKNQNMVVQSLIRVSDKPEERLTIFRALQASDESLDKRSSDAASPMSLLEVAAHIRKTVVLRTFIEVAFSEIPQAELQLFVNSSCEAAIDKAASPVLQRLIEYCTSEVRGNVYETVKAFGIEQLAFHPVGTYFIQQLIESIDDEKKRENLVDKIFSQIGDPREGLSTSAGSRVVQKAAAYASDKTLKKFIKSFGEIEVGEDEECDGIRHVSDEEKAKKQEEVKGMSKKERREKFGVVQGSGMISFALHPHACFVVQVLLKETKTRSMDLQRKSLMNLLKPHVFELAVSPWAGRIVLDQLLLSGSAQLKAAIQNVVFLKAENWLSDTPEMAHRRGGMDPTMKKALRGEHVSGEHQSYGQSNPKKIRTEGNKTKEKEEGNGKQHPKKKIFRSFKK